MYKHTMLSLALVLTSLLLLNKNEQTKCTAVLFEEWMEKHGHLIGLELSPQQIEYRYRIFEKNIESIEEQNSNPDHTYKQGVNQFTAFSQQQFQAIFLSRVDRQGSSTFVDSPEDNLKDRLDVDWVSNGAVSSVKNQGSCEASYAFATVGGIEGYYATQFGQGLQEFSAQQLIDCSQIWGNQGCSGGSMVDAYRYIIFGGGMNTQSAYPWSGVEGSCKFKRPGFLISGFYSVTTCNELEDVLTQRPISVYVDGSNFATYHSGIINSCKTDLNLAVLLVGATDQYYRLKLSWGVTWGEKGYVRLSRTKNICGICQLGVVPYRQAKAGAQHVSA